MQARKKEKRPSHVHHEGGKHEVPDPYGLAAVFDLEISLRCAFKKERAQVVVVRGGFELECAAVLKVANQRGRSTLTQLIERSGFLQMADLCVLLRLVLDVDVLPRQTTPRKVHQHITNGLQVIAT